MNVLQWVFTFSDPTPEPVEAPQGFGPVTWPALTEDELNYFWIHIDDVEPRINYRQKEMAFWREYMSYLIDVEIYNEELGNIYILLRYLFACYRD